MCFPRAFAYGKSREVAQLTREKLATIHLMTISIKNLELWTKIGITPEERSTEQRLLVSVDLKCPEVKAGKTDRIEDTVDYAEVAEIIKGLAKKERKTLEKFVDEILDEILKFKFVDSAEVEIKKFALSGAECVSIKNSKFR